MFSSIYDKWTDILSQVVTLARDLRREFSIARFPSLFFFFFFLLAVEQTTLFETFWLAGGSRIGKTETGRWYPVICSGFSTSSRWSLWGVLRFSAERPVGTRNSWGNREPLAGSAAANRESDPRMQFKPNELLPLYREQFAGDYIYLQTKPALFMEETSPLEAILRSTIRSIKHSARLTSSMYLLIDIQNFWL